MKLLTRRLIIMTAIFGVVIMSATAHADDCWKIKENDSRYYCESIYEGKPNCWRIKNLDRQNMCKALKGERTCWRIKNEDYKNMCKANTGQGVKDEQVIGAYH